MIVGKDKPPLFGDFEAQRHWMDVTVHRPMKEWYTYAPDWWLLDCELILLGLIDHFHLTSIRSTINGVCELALRSNVGPLAITFFLYSLTDDRGVALDPSHFSLETSRGMSPPGLITFMRFSVLSFEVLVWWSAVVAWMLYDGKSNGRSWRSQVS